MHLFVLCTDLFHPRIRAEQLFKSTGSRKRRKPAAAVWNCQSQAVIATTYDFLSFSLPLPCGANLTGRWEHLELIDKELASTKALVARSTAGIRYAIAKALCATRRYGPMSE
jgi:hypothetical protein